MKDKLYNADVKLEYLETQIQEEGTRTSIFYEFTNSAQMEKELGKDVYAFNDLEVSKLLRISRRSSENSIGKTLSYLNSYVKWCISSGKRGKYENGINYIDIFSRTETDLSKYVSNRQLANKILSKEEFKDLVDIAVNPVDQALLLCLYEFIGGEELYEIRSMRFEDVDVEGHTIKLHDKYGNSRTQKISRELSNVLEDTNRVKTYLANNGEVSGQRGIIEYPLSDTGYIFKPIFRKNNISDDIMTYHALLRRLRTIKNFSDYKYITANSIRDTRIIHEVIDLMHKAKAYEPTDKMYDEVVSKIYADYGVEISRMQVYNIKQKINQLLPIKEF